MQNKCIQFRNSKGENIYTIPYYPIGSIHMSITPNNPREWLGGEWELLCPGKTLVCIDTKDNDFNATKKIWGSKFLQTHSHYGSTSWNGKHIHGTASSGWQEGQRQWQPTGNSNGWGFDIPTGEAGNHYHDFTTSNAGSGNSQNLQPYMVCYIWVRTK